MQRNANYRGKLEEKNNRKLEAPQYIKSVNHLLDFLIFEVRWRREEVEPDKMPCRQSAIAIPDLAFVTKNDCMAMKRLQAVSTEEGATSENCGV